MPLGYCRKTGATAPLSTAGRVSPESPGLRQFICAENTSGLRPAGSGSEGARLAWLQTSSPGDYDFDLAAYRACREAVGPEFKLMADPVAAYNHEQALRMGRELEKLNYYWFEEPLFDVDFNGLRKLASHLDIPICGTEVLVGHHYSTAECIATGVVDMVRTDVSWKGGITPVMKTAHLAE